MMFSPPMLTVTDSVWYSLTAWRSLRQYQRAARSANGAKKAETLLHPAINCIFAVDRRFQNTREHQQDLIAFLMAVNIINALEMIDID
ncbi:Uncharacterised protein [Klebsiella pneumoniae]|uniref:Uncharacterized protein n=1 Tax=Klebsiella pneumoniae TaxID=573 RepID=A0A377W3L9_KLEPN|nr:Uncharacterised protein [Klebsiella pneumoniae]